MNALMNIPINSATSKTDSSDSDTNSKSLEERLSLSDRSDNPLPIQIKPRAIEYLIVDPENGPFKTIQSAIDASQPHSVIKIFSGLYKENLTIDRAPLKIEAKDTNSEVYIMGVKGPTMYVNVSDGADDAKIIVSHVRLTHKGGGGNKFYKFVKPKDGN
jgi:pectin methylesterase-like acyl-CoA thioesterase